MTEKDDPRCDNLACIPCAKLTARALLDLLAPECSAEVRALLSDGATGDASK